MRYIGKYTQKPIRSAVLPVVICICLTAYSMLYAGTGVELLMTGVFHGDEVTVRDGEEWMGLFGDNSGFRLVNATVTVESVEDAVLDAPGKKTGKLVGIDMAEAPVFLLRGLPGLEEGPVAGAVYDREWLKPGTVKDFISNGSNYELMAIGEGDDSWSIVDYRLVLAQGGASQELVRLETCCDDSMPALVWAGDLDRDGRLDLLLDLTDHYNVSRLTLFLSSMAEEGELVGRAAELVTYGC